MSGRGDVLKKNSRVGAALSNGFVRTNAAKRTTNKPRTRQTEDVLHNVSTADEAPTARLWQSDRIFGIDTNTSLVDGSPVSVVTCCECIKEATTDINVRHPFTFDPLGQMELHGVTVPPEHLGWRIVCGTLIGQIPELAGKRVAVVVDSSLDELAAINARTLPVNGDWLLPDPFTLIYASADAATSSVASALIRPCDRLGEFSAETIAWSQSGASLRRGPVCTFTHARRWRSSQN
jgi:hypothetical protein